MTHLGTKEKTHIDLAMITWFFTKYYF